MPTGPRTPIGERADLQPHALGPQADRRGQRERVERRHLTDPHGLDPGLLGGDGDLDRLLVGTVEPERHHDADRVAHSIAVSVGWSSSSRPVSSQVAGLTWKCAVAVWASRKRRCSGELS